MKRKFIATILIVVLAIMMCAIFVSCDSKNEYKFDENMTLDELVEAVNNLDSFTSREASGSSMYESYYGRTFFGENIDAYRREYGGFYSFYTVAFYENDRIYDYESKSIQKDYKDNVLSEGDEHWSIWDYSGYEINACYSFEQYLSSQKQWIISCITDTEKYTYSISDGNLIYYEIGKEATSYTIKNCNATDVKELLPKEYSKHNRYKKLETTAAAVN